MEKKIFDRIMIENIIKFISIWLVMALITLIGCAKGTFVPTHPIHVSTRTSESPEVGVRIGIAKINLANESKKGDRSEFISDLVVALENGMLEACRLIDPMANFATPENAGNFDMFLQPDNPYFEVEKTTYGFSVLLSMEVRLAQKGQDRERGILIDAKGNPIGHRPHAMLTLFGNKFGMIGIRIPGSPLERAINDALFNFSMKFAQKLEKRVERYLESNQAGYQKNPQVHESSQR